MSDPITAAERVFWLALCCLLLFAWASLYRRIERCDGIVVHDAVTIECQRFEP